MSSMGAKCDQIGLDSILGLLVEGMTVRMCTRTMAVAGKVM